MVNIKKIAIHASFLSFVSIGFSGCFVSFFTIGEQETFQEMYGQQYKNCGTNASYMALLEDTEAHSKTAYDHCIIYRDERPWYYFGFGKDKYEIEDERRLEKKENRTYFQDKYGSKE